MSRTFKDSPDLRAVTAKRQHSHYLGMSPSVRQARIANLLDFYEGREPLSKELAIEDAIALAMGRE